jgi:hypothetical protein
MEEKEKDHFVVPGRLTIEELHKQHEELLAAKKVSDLHPKPTVLNAMSMISVGLDFALILALPLLGFIYLGRWMDARYETKFFVVLALPLAIIVSSIGIYKQIKKLKKIINPTQTPDYNKKPHPKSSEDRHFYANRNVNIYFQYQKEVLSLKAVSHT